MRIVAWGTGLGAAVALLFVATASAQEADAPVEGVVAQPAQPSAPLTRREWVVLMAVLGEQLPAQAQLVNVVFDEPPGGVRILVRVPRDESAAVQGELVRNLQRHFGTVQVGTFSGPSEAPFVEGEISLRGVPSLDEYREQKAGETPPPTPEAAETPAAEAPAETPEGAEAPAPTPAAPTPEAAVPTEEGGAVWPHIVVKRVFLPEESGRLVVQLEVNGRDRIVPEGRSFESNRFRFVGLAPVTETTPANECVLIESVVSGTRRTFCTETVPG